MLHSEGRQVRKIEVDMDVLLDVVELEGLEGRGVVLCEGCSDNVDASQTQALQSWQAANFREVQGTSKVSMTFDYLQECLQLAAVVLYVVSWTAELFAALNQ